MAITTYSNGISTSFIIIFGSYYLLYFFNFLLRSIVSVVVRIFLAIRIDHELNIFIFSVFC